jgi:hypothetical protein
MALSFNSNGAEILPEYIETSSGNIWRREEREVCKE